MSRRSVPLRVADPDGRSVIRSTTALLCLVASSSIVVSLMGFSAALRRSDLSGGLALYFVAQVVLVLGSAWLVIFAQLEEQVLRWVALSFTVLPALMYRLREPLLVTGFDEQQHYRGLVDLLATGHLGSPNPLLPITASFPGLEALTASLHTLTGMPVMMSITATVLLARALLGLALFEGARAVGASPATAALVVILYGACPQFFFFNNQFAYQTLALALGLAGLVLVRLAEKEADRPGPRRRLLFAATVALAGCAMTHHVTSWFICGFAVLWWLTTPRGPRRKAVRTGAVCAVGTVLSWSGAVAGGLYRYLSPVFAEAQKQLVAVAHGQSQRSFVADAAGVVTPVWERATLLLYALTVVALAVASGWWLLRLALRDRSWPRALVGALALLAPAVFAGRIAPALSQIGDRSSTFTFLPWALVTGLALGSLLVRVRGRGKRSAPVAAGVLASVLLLVVGGDLLGSGPDWEKLPGPWLAAAENRSLDTETLAAAVWARANVPAGSRVVADRIPSVVLAGRSQLWAVTQSNSGLNLADLYFSAQWGPSQRDVVRRARLAYLYVDRRLATQPPHVGVYFSDGEAIGRPSARLTTAQLRKFDRIQGLGVVYAHGPVRIYRVDPLAFAVGSGVTGQRSREEASAAPWHGLVGLALGVGIAAALSRRRPRSPGEVLAPGHHLARLALVVGGGTVVSTALFAAHVIPDRWFLLGLVLPQAVRLLAAGVRPQRVELSARVVFLATAFVATAVLWVVNVVVASHDTNVRDVNRIVADVEAGRR